MIRRTCSRSRAQSLSRTDYLPYLRGVAPDVHTALITRGATSGPNEGPEMALAKSTHADLTEFSDFWLQRV